MADSKDSIAPQYGNRDGNGKQVFNRFPVQRGHYGIGQFGFDAETVADSVDAVDAAIHLHQVHGYGHYDNGDERAGIFFENFGVMAMITMLAMLTTVFHQLTVSK